MLLGIPHVLQQNDTPIGAGIVQQTGPQPTAHLPGLRGEVQAGGLGYLLRLLDAVAAFAGGLNRGSKVNAATQGDTPLSALVVYCGDRLAAGLGRCAGGRDARLGDRPLGPRHVEAGVVEKRHERERIEVPLPQRPVGQIPLEIRLQKLPQLRVVQRASLELLRRLLGRQRLGLKPSTTGQQGKNDCLGSDGFRDTHVLHGPVYSRPVRRVKTNE